MKRFIKLLAWGIIILITFSTAGAAITHLQIGEHELTYKNFTYLKDDICTHDNNWCGRVDIPGKAIIYGSIETEVKVPRGTKDVEVWIHIPCNGLGEGFYGRPGSVAVISVDNESKPEAIKSSDALYHGFYYKYKHCESFLNSFNVAGDKITLKIEMIADARLDVEKVVLKFYDGINESTIFENDMIIEPENYTVNYSVDSDNDGINDTDDDCPETKGHACNNGCPTETDVDVDGFQEDNENCPNYDKYPYDHDNDGIPTVEDCDDNNPGNTKIKGDDDMDGVSNCVDKCPYEKGGDKYGCPKVKDELMDEQIPVNWGFVFLAVMCLVILILIIILFRK